MLFLMLLDGLNYRIFSQLLQQGRLPNLQRYLLNELPGVWGPVLTTFPSATAPALPETLTGKYCHRLIRSPRKIHAFNRETSEILRYEFVADAWVNEPGDLFDLTHRYRGPVISLFKGNFNKASANIYSEFFYSLDAITDFSSMDIFNYDEFNINELTKRLERNHHGYALAFVYLAVPDLNGHFHGVDEPRYPRSLEETDRLLGDFFQRLQQIIMPSGRSLFHESHFVLFGDHGMTSTGNYLDIQSLLKAVNIPAADLTRAASLIRNKLMSDWSNDIDAVIVPGGSTISELYLRAYHEFQPAPWNQPPGLRILRHYPARMNPQFQHNLLSLLSAFHGIDLVMAEEQPGIIRLQSSAGSIARIYQRRAGQEDAWCYQLLHCDEFHASGDPLRYLGQSKTAALLCHDPLLTPATAHEESFTEHFHPLTDWLAASWETEYPLAVPLIPKAFASAPTRSDIILTSAPGFNFVRWSKGDHGDLRRESILSGLLISGPRINPGCKLNSVRLVDLFPTLCQLLDIPQDRYLPADIDGRPISGLLDLN